MSIKKSSILKLLTISMPFVKTPTIESISPSKKSYIPCVILLNKSVKLKLSRDSEASSNPNFLRTHDTKSFIKSIGTVINDVTNPSIAPLRPRNKLSISPEPSLNPSIAPMIVSHATMIIPRGANTFPAIPAIFPIRLPNLPTCVPIVVKKLRTSLIGFITISVIMILIRVKILPILVPTPFHDSNMLSDIIL